MSFIKNLLSQLWTFGYYQSIFEPYDIGFINIETCWFSRSDFIFDMGYTVTFSLSNNDLIFDSGLNYNIGQGTLFYDL